MRFSFSLWRTFGEICSWCMSWFIVPPQARRVAQDVELGLHAGKPGDVMSLMKTSAKSSLLERKHISKCLRGNFILDKMKIYFYVLGSRTKSNIGLEVSSANIIITQTGRREKRS